MFSALHLWPTSVLGLAFIKDASFGNPVEEGVAASKSFQPIGIELVKNSNFQLKQEN
jgi:hypothetical protein